MKTKQLKAVSSEIKIEDRLIKGYASIFGNRDKVGDIVVSGSMAKTLAEKGPPRRDIKVLFNHDSNRPIGYPTVLTADNKGLYFEAAISKTQVGDDVLELIRDQVIDKTSIGYITHKNRYDQASDTNFLLELELFEFSPVTFPANVATSVEAMKGLFDDPAAFVKSLLSMMEPGDIRSILRSKSREAMLFPLDHKFDPAASAERMGKLDRKDAEEFYLVARDGESLSQDFLLADVVDGKARFVPEAVFAMAKKMVAGELKLSTEESYTARVKLDDLFREVRLYTGDVSIKSPWAEDSKPITESTITELASALEKSAKSLRDLHQPQQPTLETEPGKGTEKDTKAQADSILELANMVQQITKSLNH